MEEDKLHFGMREIRRTKGKTPGDVFKYIRGEGLVRRESKEK